MSVPDFIQDLSILLHQQEALYANEYQGNFSDQNITQFVTDHKAAIYQAIDKTKARLFTQPISGTGETEIVMAIHTFWAQLVHDLKSLHDPDLPPLFGD